MKTFSRRACLHRLGLAAAGAALAPLPVPRAARAAEAGASVKPTPAEAQAISKLAREFMERFEVPGLSVAFARHREFVHQQGFGFADTAARTAVTPAHAFRVASISKPFTSTTIFSFIEQRRLALEDRIFGEHGRLGFDFGKKIPADVQEITLRHLLTHTGGGWGNKKNDPMFRDPALTQRELIEWTLKNLPLEHAPGTSYAYSNFGYCVLGRLIEKLAGQPYAQVVQREVLAKCGITSMRIAGNTLAQRAKDEVVYYSPKGGGNPYGMNVPRMDSHGGWIATASDLVRFASHVDGLGASRNILKPETISLMTTPGTVNEGYACGWSVNKAPNWWHGGSLPGTSTIMVRTASGLCWSALTNTRTEGLSPALDQLMWKMVRAVPAWKG
ncbi:MAG: beta-lactamase family protein [Verrucomicrobia bacterium]|nr:beta-lactamase family protein [Verrucomicrobiota bacterium]